MRQVDHALFYAINRWPEGLSPFFFFISECTKWLPTRLVLLALLIGMLINPKSRRAAIYTMLAWPMANEVTDWFKFGFRGPRPNTELHDVILRVNWMDSFGTASAHSANMGAVAFVMTYFLGWKWGSVWIVIAFLTGLSRIYNGVHYPYQVLLGWTTGCLVAGLIILIGKKIETRFAKPSPEAPTVES